MVLYSMYRTMEVFCLMSLHPAWRAAQARVNLASRTHQTRWASTTISGKPVPPRSGG